MPEVIKESNYEEEYSLASYRSVRGDNDPAYSAAAKNMSNNASNGGRRSSNPQQYNSPLLQIASLRNKGKVNNVDFYRGVS